MDALNDIIVAFNDFAYTWIVVILLAVAGIWFTISTKAVQIRFIPTAIRTILEKPIDKKAMSPFQALMVSTASRVGIGNIAGVTTAIVIAGPGAVVWMWIMATLGAASAFVESTLAQVYKRRDGSAFRGGPSYYIEQALKLRWLGVAFSISLIVCYAYGFNALQANNMVATMAYYTGESWTAKIVIGLLIAAATAFTILGGQRHITWVTSVLVPIMASLYILIGLGVIVTHLGSIPTVLSQMFASAFDFQAIFGGFVGSVIMLGVKRGLFSNEAGMGSAPNAAAAAHTSHPAKQGFVQVVSVFIDTMIICSTTAFLVLTSGVDLTDDSIPAMAVVQNAVGSQFGEVGIALLSFAVLLFAFSSIIGNYYYTESNMFFILKRHTSLVVFRSTVILAVFIGSIVGYDLAWNVADLFMIFMTVINIPVILILGKQALLVLDDFIAQKKVGKDPVFVSSSVGIDTECWNGEPSVMADPKPAEPVAATV
ncbi:MAG: alanine:cation symporter family protein [Propionibacteriaceae bacterium]|nr:alanine:cation symporter family protein [Propionibacteriaceae bacterium]